MIEAKILDQNDERLDALEPFKTHLLHLPALRINTDTITDTNHVLRERTNTTTVAVKDAISPNILSNVYYTPNSSRACGRPSLTMKPNRFNRATSICGSPTDSLRRQRRYTIAEQALEHALKSCTRERSPQELQILALEKATAALSARANESRERAAKLRVCLADRAVDPKSYTALQSDRWMEERRQFEADREVSQLSQHLASLKLKRGVPEPGRFNFHENLPVTPLDNEARRQANLIRFFERSPTRTSLHIYHKCRPLFVSCTFSRRITMSDISPLRLRPPTNITQRFTTQNSHPKSIGGEPSVPPMRSSKPRVASGPSRSSLVRNMGPSNAERKRNSSLSQSSTLSSRLPSFNEFTDDVMTSTRPSTPPLSIASTSSNGTSHISRVPSETPPQAPSGGVATIYASSSPRSHMEILAELDEDSVRVPEYAVNLLEEFDLIHHDITLPERSLSLKPREEPAVEVPRPSEESDTGPYTSFALPPFQPDPLWSHTSLNAPSTPRSHVPTLHPLSSGSSTPSGLSTPTATRPTTLPSRPHSLLFLMRKRKDLQCSPASSMSNLDGDSARGSKRRFSLFTRK
ncbi:uncharacterized protein EDB93DRAFT_1151568 [Suillus bovinus]|uniref:uncharacterized protein n=1 Tax=Suillus bovinus TaxID=48563 RepID=UPI001B85CD24|nr:uncharacterized protein EDB93DRAFT_1151568 [Suillus bovinus]KAG2145316.1 hypothetical protein EDB93DRAFT_1151568 [Suillus bovinus]